MAFGLSRYWRLYGKLFMSNRKARRAEKLASSSKLMPLVSEKSKANHPQGPALGDPQPSNCKTISGDQSVKGKIETHLPPDVKNSNAEEDDRKNSRETIKQWVDGITLVFVVIVACLNGCQVRQSQRSADYSNTANDQSKSTTKMQLRAYMVVSNIQIIIPTSAHPMPGTLQPGTDTFRIIEKNTGLTPANKVSLTLDPTPVLTGGPNISYPGPKTPPSSPIVGAGEVTHNDENLTKLDPEAIKDINDGIAHIKYQGVLTYYDIFGELHHTWLCFIWVGGTSGMQACPDHNDFD